MPEKIEKDPSPPRPEGTPPEPNLYLSPATGSYYVKRYVPSLGKERVLNLRETNRYRAIQKKNQVVAQWLGSRAVRGDATIEGIVFEMLKAMEESVERGVLAPATFLDFEGHVRLHLLQTEDKRGAAVTGSYAGLSLSQALTHWPDYKALQRRLNPQRKLLHDRKHLRAIFKYAYDRELIDRIPALKLDSVDLRTKKAEEYTNEEYQAIQHAANPKLALKLETMLLTSLRADTVRQLEWTWFNWQSGEVRIPGAAMKMKEDHVVVFPPALLAKYRTRYESRIPTHCFPHRDDPRRPESKTDKGWQRLRKKLSITKKRHWLRGTGVRRAIRAGVPAVTAQKAARMSDRTMKEHYYEPNLDDRRKYAETIQRSVEVESTPEASTSPDPKGQRHA